MNPESDVKKILNRRRFMTFEHAMIGPDHNNGWSWAADNLAGIPAITRVLITLYRSGVKRVILPAEAHSIRWVVDIWRKKKTMPQIFWEEHPSTAGFDLLYVRGGILFEPRLIQWLKQAAREFPTGNICVTGRNDRFLLAVFRGSDDPKQHPLHLPPEKIFSQRPVSDVSAPDELFYRSIAELKTAGNGRDLLAMVGKPDEAGHVKWIRDKTFPLIRFLSETSISPNQLTWFGFLLGIAGAFFIAEGEYGYGVLGALLLCGSWILDGMDGTLARLTFSESPHGAALDTTLGHLTNIVFFISLVWAVYGNASLLTAGFFIFLVTASIAVAHRVCQAEGRLRKGTNPDRQIRRVQVFLEQIHGRDFAVLVLLFALFDGFKFFLWVCMAGIQAFWMVHLWLIRKHRKYRRASIS
ncbi:MAG: CDP-alcohol phosphatidyltransferase family protein [Desulfobacteraceae bacterium]|nr:MAG: CDP-alcohol phosphatidyltransferase family protein [Desulfobacteraceae bacterium]